MSGYHLMQMRVRRGLSQKELGNMINLSRSQVSRIENDLQAVSDDTFVLMCKAFEVDEAELQRAIDMPKPDPEDTDPSTKTDERFEDLRLSIAGELEENNRNQSAQLEQLRQLLSDQRAQIESFDHSLQEERKHAKRRTWAFVSVIIVLLIMLPLLILGLLYFLNTLPGEVVNNQPVPAVEIKKDEV